MYKVAEAELTFIMVIEQKERKPHFFYYMVAVEACQSVLLWLLNKP